GMVLRLKMLQCSARLARLSFATRARVTLGSQISWRRRVEPGLHSGRGRILRAEAQAGAFALPCVDKLAWRSIQVCPCFIFRVVETLAVAHQRPACGIGVTVARDAHRQISVEARV